MSKFEGKWEIQTGMYKGGIVEIYKLKGKNKFQGKITELNDNKYVKLFVSEGDIIISGIKRFSNFRFEVTQKRVASELMSAYDLGTTDKFEVEFDKNFNIVSSDTGRDILFKKVVE